ncbi:putative guanylate-binding protein [Helianthus annuus]|uniref:Guanylate-binding protein n=1 Tax=Helianthus annuus TaxID=4232 RepID=A0A9K3HQK3_HELAN|nr:putative guanylate-binding protein [Helianthus annuus]KAJ0502038.1 putative guanylate-binding protein [Helianthus annuus]KAJ0509996.1 putative guanylate-binding protein [Helianthus annuus]KAJ0517962.1 putative guanylate-binding protein [Helianthus annuus]KAJ0629481.1 putative guanylate-binding protein [Helianthus annuus]
MDPEVVSVLQLFKEPIGVVSVCGRARQGKSYILNQCLLWSFDARVLSENVAYEIGYLFCFWVKIRVL